MIKVTKSCNPRIHQGSFLVSINDQKIEDVLDYRFYNDPDTTRKLLFEYQGNRYAVIISPHEESWFDIEEPLFRQCDNRCDFCFINGLPQGLRAELYVRDDDYRLSFLFGNFISLTNVTHDDIKRIGRLKLSPLYISVHATDPQLRSHIFKNEKAEQIMEQLAELADENIQLHCQIVVIPGLNDGDELVETISSLNRLYPGIQSVGVVPVGTTRFLRNIAPMNRKAAFEIVTVVDTLHAHYREKTGIGFVYCADEFFALVQRPLPGKSYYDGFPQLENGIGMIRKFLDEINNLHITRAIQGKNLFITGVLARPYVDILVLRLNSSRGSTRASVECIEVENKLFGPRITVSGLLCGDDIASALNTVDKSYDRVILPPNCTNDSGDLIDDHIFNDTNIMVSPQSLQELVKCLQS